MRCPRARRCASILDGLFAALFPMHFGSPDLTEEGIDYFVGHTLDATLRALVMQVQRELQFDVRADQATPASGAQRRFEITREFAARLPRVRALLESDVHAAYEGDPAAKSLDEVRFCYPGHHRASRTIGSRTSSTSLGVPLLARIIAELAHSATGIDIHPGAEIGGELLHRPRHRRRHRRDVRHRRARAPLPGGDAGRQELSGR